MKSKSVYKLLIWFSFACLVVGCGVRGDPVPPGYPAELGRGRPSFKDPQKIQSYPALPSSEEIDKKLDEEEQEDKTKD